MNIMSFLNRHPWLFRLWLILVVVLAPVLVPIIWAVIGARECGVPSAMRTVRTLWRSFVLGRQLECDEVPK